jgi:hypothetical protein
MQSSLQGASFIVRDAPKVQPYSTKSRLSSARLTHPAALLFVVVP